MATIARLVAEIGGDPTGLRRALKQSTGDIQRFVGDVGAGTRNIGNFVDDTLKKLKGGLRSDRLRIREDLIRGLISPEEATRAGVEAGAQFNRGLLKALDQLRGSGQKFTAGLENRLSSELLSTGVRAGGHAGVAAGRSFAQTLTATIHRHRALIPTIAGLILGQALASGAEIGSALNGEERVIATGKAAEKILENMAMLASFLLPPIPGLITAVVGGSLAALVGMFTKSKEQMHEFAAQFKREMDGMVDAASQIDMVKKLRDVQLGTRSGGMSQLIAGAFGGQVDEKGNFKSGLRDFIAQQARDTKTLITLKKQFERAIFETGATVGAGQAVPAPVKHLQDILAARKKIIQQGIREEAELTRQLLNPPGAERAVTGLPGVNVKGKSPADELSDAIKAAVGDTSRLISLYRSLGTISAPHADVTDRIVANYIRLYDLLQKLPNPWTEQAIGIRETLAEIIALVRSAEPHTGVVSSAAAYGVVVKDPLERLAAAGKQLILAGVQITPQASSLTQALRKLKDGAASVGSVFLSFGAAILSRVLAAFNPFKDFGQIIELLNKIIGPFRPVIAQLIGIVAVVLELVQPLLTAIVPILQAFVPLIRALLPLVKYVAIMLTYFGQVVALVAGVILKIVAAFANVVGGIVKAIGHFIAQIPFLGSVGRGIESFGDGLLGFANGANEAGRDMFAAVRAFADARKQIAAVDVSDTSRAVKALGDAANYAAGTLTNVPDAWKITHARYLAQDPRFPSGSTGTPGNPTGAGTAPGTTPSNGEGPVIIEGDVIIDARNLTPAQLFDAIKKEAKSQSLARFGTTARASEALNY